MILSRSLKVFGLVFGGVCRAISMLNWLRYDTVLQDTFGFKSMPSQSTY